jgi:hypothetical protein
MGFWIQLNHVAKFMANKIIPPIAGSFVMNNKSKSSTQTTTNALPTP